MLLLSYHSSSNLPTSESLAMWAFIEHTMYVWLLVMSTVRSLVKILLRFYHLMQVNVYVYLSMSIRGHTF